MGNVLLVGAGGFVGSTLRFVVTNVAQSLFSERFPIGTLIVNLVGCLLIGAISQVFESRSESSESLRLFLVVGILGGFTTFSSFGNDTINAMRSSAVLLAGINVASQVVGGLFLVWLGRLMVQVVCK
ncbi:MAG TPA: fluoride efflux transporter CrcB [Schlesneria sp.]|jgi:CrcB protein